MPGQNAMEIKERILGTLKRRGPSLPVHIAKETGLSILFASAFLSELASEQKLKISNMKVGSSPVYFLNEHAYMLEKLSQSLNNREKEAFLLLREKKFLKDTEQPPVIRVALRAIMDFAIPLHRGGQIYWRYYITPESEFTEPTPQIIIMQAKEEPIKQKINIIEIKEEEKEPQAKTPEIKVRVEKVKKTKKEGHKDPNISERREKKEEKRKTKKKTPKRDDHFFNKVKEWVSASSMEILDIQSFNRNELQLRIKHKNEEQLLMAYNKKRINDSDLIKANKKAKELGLRYIILSLGEPQKKISDLIDATKNMSEIKKME